MNVRYEKLKGLLMELFQLDQPDLDFGIYRILHARKHEIEAFLDKTLPQQVQEAFSQYWAAEKETLQKELARAKEQAISLGLDPSQVRKVQELEDRLKETAAQAVSLENEVYDHLYNFFRRYYSEGDFVSKRVYKEGVYAIPYEGEEVKLYWANSDQYYIKTSEYLRDYTFRLRPWSEDQPMRVHFKIVDAAEGEHGNVKPADGKERVFILTKENFISIENGELVLRFEYRPATLEDWLDEAPGKTKPPTQKDLIAIAVKRVFNVKDPALAPWIAELQKEHILANNEKAGYSKLEAHLNRYTKRNTFDYFIHKDLGGFLRRELDFYIKSEVMRLDDIEDETAPRVEQYLSKIKVIRRIAGKIIDFLAQIENFQKKLWLKKKFVVDTQYLITVGNIPEEFYPEIAANDAQREEWVRLLAIDEIKGNLATPGYSVPLSTEFLKAHPTLVLDTSHFDAVFTARLVSAMNDLDCQVDGLLVQSENFHALRLLAPAFRERVQCIYIDPPYNTGQDGFLYKDSYQHASWLSMMRDRVILGSTLLAPDGSFLISCDDGEAHRLRLCLESESLGPRFMSNLVWKSRQNVDSRTNTNISNDHEFILAYGVQFRGADKDYRKYSNPDNDPRGEWMSDNMVGLATREARPNLHYAIRTGIVTSVKCADEHLIVEIGGQSYVVPRARLFGPAPAVGQMAMLCLELPGATQTDGMKEQAVLALCGLPEPLDGRQIPTGEYECPPKGWRYEPMSMARLAVENRIIWPESTSGRPRKKTYWRELKSAFTGFSSVVGYTAEGTKDLAALFGSEGLIAFPKPVSLLQTLVQQTTDQAGTVLDFFAGSGTTGHAVINLNRADNGRRKFILVEMADYFDTVLIPRIKKVTYSPEWKDGKPTRLPTPEETKRSPRVIKVLRLESYEDTLNNLELRRAKAQQELFDKIKDEMDGFREQYLLHYMLDFESRESLLNIETFKDPTTYKLRVRRPGSDETRDVYIDLLETFNWLLGLTVHHISAPQTFHAEFERNEEGRLMVRKGCLRPNPNGPWWFRTVEGINPEGQRVLIIWRKLTGDPEKDNVVLDYWFEKQGFSARDSEFDLIYVNGGHNLGNRLEEGAGFKVRLIEEEFHRLMFETEGV